jgi:hypothetical protein
VAAFAVASVWEGLNQALSRQHYGYLLYLGLRDRGIRALLAIAGGIEAVAWAGGFLVVSYSADSAAVSMVVAVGVLSVAVVIPAFGVARRLGKPKSMRRRYSPDRAGGCLPGSRWLALNAKDVVVVGRWKIFATLCLFIGLSAVTQWVLRGSAASLAAVYLSYFSPSVVMAYMLYRTEQSAAARFLALRYALSAFALVRYKLALVGLAVTVLFAARLVLLQSLGGLGSSELLAEFIGAATGLGSGGCLLLWFARRINNGGALDDLYAAISIALFVVPLVPPVGALLAVRDVGRVSGSAGN